MIGDGRAGCGIVPRPHTRDRRAHRAISSHSHMTTTGHHDSCHTCSSRAWRCRQDRAAKVRVRTLVQANTGCSSATAAMPAHCSRRKTRPGDRTVSRIRYTALGGIGRVSDTRSAGRPPRNSDPTEGRAVFGVGADFILKTRCPSGPCGVRR